MNAEKLVMYLDRCFKGETAYASFRVRAMIAEAAIELEARLEDATQKAAHLESLLREREKELGSLRTALQKVIEFHATMDHGEECPARLCGYGDCEHSGDGRECEEQEIALCECCVGVGLLAVPALKVLRGDPNSKPQEDPQGEPSDTL